MTRGMMPVVAARHRTGGNRHRQGGNPATETRPLSRRMRCTGNPAALRDVPVMNDPLSIPNLLGYNPDEVHATSSIAVWHTGGMQICFDRQMQVREEGRNALALA